MRKRNLVIKALALALVFGLFAFFGLSGNNKQRGSIPRAKAGNITSPTWTLSDTTVGAKSVTYTHTFTTATAIPANSGRIEIRFNTDQGPIGFTENTRLGATTTDALETAQMEGYPEGDKQMVIALQNGATAIPAGAITIAFSGMENIQGGVMYTNTYTLDNGQALDGNKFGGTNSQIKVGSIALTVNASSGGSPVVGYEFEVHPFSCCGMWRAKTDANGSAVFYGIPNGQYVLETSHSFDPNDPNAKDLSKYMAIEPQNITIPIGSAVNVVLQESNKFIEVTVKYSDTGAVIQNAFVNAFSMGGGGFSFAQTNSSGKATLNLAVKSDKSNINIMVMPPMGPPPGQGGPQPQQEMPKFVAKGPIPISFNKAPTEAETVTMEVLVSRPDATVSGILLNPDNTPANGNLDAFNFKTHSGQPIWINSNDGSFSFETSAGLGEWELHRFDPSGQYAMPRTKFTVKKGANNIGTIKLIAYDGAITVKTYRIDSGSAVALANAAVMAFDPKNPGPPIMGFTGADGVGTVRVMKGQNYRVMADPGGGGGGKREGGPKDGERIGLDRLRWIGRAFAQEGPGGPGGPGDKQMIGATDGNQLFPTTGPQKGKHGDTLTFNFDKADIAVTVITKDSAGSLVTDGNWISARPSGSGGMDFGPGFGGPGAGGAATVYTTAAEFIFNAFYPPDSQYVGREKKATISGATTVELVVARKTVTVSGEIQDASNGNAVIKGETAKKLNLMVGAFFKGGFSDGVVNPDTGTYVVKVPPETDVNIGVAPADAIMGGTSEYVPSLAPDAVNAKDGESVTRHLKLSKVDATIVVTVKDQNGNVLEGINVFANNKLADIVGPEGPAGPGPGPGPDEGPEFGFDGVTGTNGKATIMVAPDTYNLVTDARERGLFATEISRVEIKSQETKEVTINLVVADATLEVEVNKSNGGDLNEAAVQVFNDKGTIAFQAYDGSADDKDGTVNGVVKFDVPANKSGDAYTIKAGKDDAEAGNVEQSGFNKAILDKSETEKITLTAATESGALAKPVSTSVSTSSSATIDLTKSGTVEASLAIPSGALSSGTSSSEGDSSSSSDTATISITPMKAESVSTKSDIVIRGISIEAVDGNGSDVSQLSAQASGTIHYADSDIPAGMTEAQFISKSKIKSFNEDAGVWEDVAASNADANTNTFTFATTHFTDFAITTSSDTTAPTAPSSVSASAGDAKVTLRWTNPTDSDLAGIKIYRSGAEGTVGDLITTITNTTTTSYENSGLTNGTKQFYVVRSYDTAANISTNTTQVNATPAAVSSSSSSSTTLPATGLGNSLRGLLLKVSSFLSNLF